MHRFRSASSIRRFRTVAFLICLGCSAGPLLFCFLLLPGLATWDHSSILLFLYSAGALGVLMLLAWALGRGTRCPLCHVAILGSNGCSKNPKSRTLLGSYRLRVSLFALFRGWFRCPYCAEPILLEPRESGAPSRSRSGSRSR
jgi:hypothetical protein